MKNKGKGQSMIEINSINLGKMLDVLKEIEDNSIDSIVTDPPYGIKFMGKRWDYNVPTVEEWKECLRVLKPGGYALVACGTRTQHRMVVNLEDAGFEIRDIIGWVYGCYSEDTEVLTCRGWLQYSEVTNDDRILQWDKDSNSLSWIKPKNRFEYSIEEEMVLFENKHTSQLITKNHNVYAKIRKHQRNNKPEKYEIVKAGDIKKCWQIDLPLAGIYVGEKAVQHPYLVGWWLTDAWIHVDKKACMFSQSKPTTLNKLKQYFINNNVRFSEYTKPPKKDTHNIEHTFYVTGEISEYLISNFPNRELSWDMLIWNKESRVLLVEGLLDGDGSIKEKQYSRVFWSKSKDRLDIFQALCVSLNMRSYIDYKKGCVYLNMKHNSTQLQSKHKKPLQPYTGKVWCFETETGAFVVRRNGKAFISGNSGFPKSLNIGKQVDKIQGNKREKVGQNPAILQKQAKDFREGKRKIVDSLNSGASQRNNGFITLSADITKGNSDQEGWGTALKPAMELWTLCRKPIEEKTVAENCIKWGTGGLNIDGCRIPLNNEKQPTGSAKRVFKSNQYTDQKIYGDNKETSLLGRFPANLIHDGSEEVLELFPESKSGKNIEEKGTGGIWKKSSGLPCGNQYGDEGSAARFFYCAKASRKERGEGNNHPTVKPLALMRYLCKLITPKNGIILDPYCGSGTTGLAAKEEGFRYILIDKEEESVKTAKKRIESITINY